MADFYFLVFVILCSTLVGAIIIKPARVYEYPYFLGCMFSVFILPQMLSLRLNPSMVPAASLPPTILMSVLCLLMAVAGYRYAPSIQPAKFFDLPLDQPKLLWVTLGFTGAGYFFLM